MDSGTIGSLLILAAMLLNAVGLFVIWRTRRPAARAGEGPDSRPREHAPPPHVQTPGLALLVLSLAGLLFVTGIMLMFL